MEAQEVAQSVPEAFSSEMPEEDAQTFRDWRRHLTEVFHREADASDTIAKCYFIGGEAGPVKIGYAANVEHRLRTIQAHCPVKVSVLALASGGMARETAYHHQFQDYRLHGEWFERCTEIEVEIARLQSE